MSIRKQAIPLLHLDTGPPVRNPCSSDTVFHADDRIISSISVNQKGYEHLKTNLPQKKTNHSISLVIFALPFSYSPSVTQWLPLHSSFCFLVPPTLPSSAPNPQTRILSK